MPAMAIEECQKCVRLFEAHSAADRMVMSLVKARFTSSIDDTRLSRLVDEALETARRDRERVIQVLREHRKEHGATWSG